MYLSTYLSIYLSFSLSIYVSIYLSMYLSIYVSIYLCIYVSIYIFIYLSMYLSIYLSLYLSMYLSISRSIYLFIYLSIYSFTVLCWTLTAFSVSWSFTQSVGLLGREISPSQIRYLHKGHHKHRINARKSHMHALSGIRTHDPSVRASEDS
jgi:hypothetical protein